MAISMALRTTGWVAAFIVFFGAASRSPAGELEDARQHDVIRHVDAAVYARVQGIASYTAKEHYAVYRNGDAKAATEMNVQTVYEQATGKRYTTIDHSGSEFLRNNILEKILSSEREMTKPENRETAYLTSLNYEMQIEPGTVEMNGHECLIIDLKPRHKSQYLFDGKSWVDAQDYTLVHLEGRPSQSPSFFAGDTTVARDYAKIDGYSMATHAEAHSHSFLLGDTLLKIDYTDYHIRHAVAAARP